MRAFKWGAVATLALLLAGFLHWSLPSRDIVRIVGAEIARRDVETRGTEGGAVTRTRDVRYINAVTPEGRPRVYRNEDAGLTWPPYLKFDSANLAARALDAVSDAENPRWMVVTHYGWRAPFLSMFPNAVSMRPAEGPEERLIPWFNIVVLTLLAAGLILAWRRAARWLERRR